MQSLYRKVASVYCLILFIAISAEAQVSNERCKWLKASDSPVLLDSLTLIPGSLRNVHSSDSLIIENYDPNSGILKFKISSGNDSILICYNVFPVNFRQSYNKRSMAEYDSNAMFKSRPLLKNDLLLQREEIFATEGIHKTGSLIRGISFGNTQNVFVNSALNLQMEGKLSENLNIRASISDQNIPYQPEGNTQRLQEFDRVFIQIYNDNIALNAGDIVLQNPENHFLKYYKNVQGAQFQTKYKIGEKGTAQSSVSASVAKGKFASTIVDPLEGVLGPYRLRGPSGERFIIVISNSERVFVDGKLLERGWDHDYIIDYNMGEVTFTNKVVITKFSRIRVDFEYSDRNYSRTILSADHSQKNGRFNFFGNFYQEKDNPNQPLLFNLRDKDKQLLSEIGDQLDQAVIPSYDSVVFEKNQILYAKVDTIYQGNRYQIFKQTNDPERANWKVSFSSVGAGKGNYRQKRTTANGRVFEWTGPVNGVQQGDYEPVNILPAPNKKQMITLGGGVDLTGNEKVYTEMAFSDHDINLYSSQDSEDNKGFGFKTGIASMGRNLGKYKFKSLMDYEFTNKNFNPIDRFRYIEFDRDWSLEPDRTGSLDDHILTVTAGLEKDLNNQINYKLVKRNRGLAINGFQHYANVAQTLGRIQLLSDLFYLKNEQDIQYSEWVRYNATAFYKSKFILPGYTFSLDKNKISNVKRDSIMRTAMNFQEHKFFIRSNDSLKTSFELNYAVREDNAPYLGELMKNNLAHTVNFAMSRSGDKSNLSFLVTYRNLENLNSGTDKRSEETIMGRIDYGVELFDRHIRSDLTYAVSNGRELRREFMFLQVPSGEGTHTWRDDNADGVQDLSEFYEAVNPDERNFVKIFVPTDEYILAYANNFNYRFSAEMPRAWRNSTGMKKIISRFSNNTFWTIDNKTTDEDLTSRLIPFFYQSNNEYLISSRDLFRTTFFFNRANPKFGFDANVIRSNRKQLLTNGFEQRKNKEYQVNSRLNLNRDYNIRMQVGHALRGNISDFLLGRDYLIESYKLSPEFSWQPGTNFRLTGSYAFTDKLNLANITEKREAAQINEFALDLRLTKMIQSTFNATARYINIDFEGVENTPVGYDLLQALRPGKNFTLSINWQQKLVSGLQLNLNYEGRKSASSQLVHIGKMQVTALF
jgi:hypothetical protein